MGLCGTKRSTPDDGVQLRHCLQCVQPYSEQENSYTACSYHNGYLEIDKRSYLWAELCDGRLHGEIDSDETRERHPAAFRWTCCDQIGTSIGCTRGRHFAVNVRRGRYYENGRVGLGRPILPLRTATPPISRSTTPCPTPPLSGLGGFFLPTPGLTPGLTPMSTPGLALTPPAIEHDHEHEHKKLKPQWCY